MARNRRDVPWLTQRENGVYYVNWYDEAKRRSYRQSLDTRDAGDATKAYGRFLISGPARPVGDDGLTVSQVLDDYQREHVDVKVVDVQRQKGVIANLKKYFKDDLISSIDIVACRAYGEARRSGEIGGGMKPPGPPRLEAPPETIPEEKKEKWLRKQELRNAKRDEQGRIKRQGSDSTIRRELNCLVAASNHAIRWKRLKAADAPLIELPSENRSTEVKFLTKDQVKALLSAASGHLRDFILLAYYTAARRESIERLTRFQVNLETGRINLLPRGARVTKKRKPVVPIYEEIQPTVKRLYDEAVGEFLFPHGIDFYKPFALLAQACGFKAHPHMLRHSRATHMLMDGEDIYKVARLLGDNVKTVDDVYGHAVPEFLETTSNVASAKEPQKANDNAASKPDGDTPSEKEMLA